MDTIDIIIIAIYIIGLVSIIMYGGIKNIEIADVIIFAVLWPFLAIIIIVGTLLNVLYNFGRKVGELVREYRE